MIACASSASCLAWEVDRDLIHRWPGTSSVVGASPSIGLEGDCKATTVISEFYALVSREPEFSIRRQWEECTCRVGCHGTSCVSWIRSLDEGEPIETNERERGKEKVGVSALPH